MVIHFGIQLTKAQKMTKDGWHFSLKDGETCGPISLPELRDAVQRGEITTSDLVWHKSLGSWRRIGELPLITGFVDFKKIPPPIATVRRTVENDVPDHTTKAQPRLDNSTTAKEPNRLTLGKFQNLKPSTVTAIGMVVATLLLPVGMFAIFMLSMSSSSAENARIKASSMEIVEGHTLRQDENGFFVSEGPDERKAREAGQAMGALIGGLCCPMVPYAIVMLTLGTVFIAFRSAGK